MNLNEIIKKAKDEINLNQSKPISFEIRKNILDNSSQNLHAKAILETLKLNRQQWMEEVSNDNSFDMIFNEIVNFFTNKSNHSNGFIKKVQIYHTNAEDIISDGKFKAGYSLLALVKFGYELESGKFYTEDELDPDSDSENWSSLFIGSLAYNYGAGDLSSINKERNREYWEFFLNLISHQEETIVQNIPVAIIETNYSLNEKQTNIENSDVYSLIEYIIDRYSNFFDHKDHILISICLVNNIQIVKGFINYKKMANQEIYRITENNNLFNEFMTLKNKMYNVDNMQGAWFVFSLEFQGKKLIKTNFNYDNKDHEFDEFIDINDYKEDFKKYPRHKDHMPYWLKNS